MKLNKFFAAVASLAVICSAAPLQSVSECIGSYTITASAEEGEPAIKASGSCGAQGDNVKWTLDNNGLLTISGTGAIEDYDKTVSPIRTYMPKDVKKVIIEDGVTRIGNRFFKCSNSGSYNFKSVTISNSVEVIGTNAFEYCTGLTEITIPDSVNEIQTNAFYGCTNLKYVRLSSNIETIGDSVFFGCGSLVSVTATVTAPCSIKKTENIWKKNNKGTIIVSYLHPEEKDKLDAVDPTCEKEGLTEGEKCSICDEIFTSQEPIEALGHVWGEWVTTKEPTCTETGEQERKCTREGCGESEIETLQMVDHQYNGISGKCDCCGRLIKHDSPVQDEDKDAVKCIGHSLSLKGNIGVNYYTELSDDVVNAEDVYMLFTLPNGKEQKVTLAEANKKECNANTYVFQCKVAAKEMSDAIKAVLYVGENTYQLDDYSVKTYADAVSTKYKTEQNEAFAATYSLVEAMVNYGAYSQAYFNYNVENPANAGFGGDANYSGEDYISVVDADMVKEVLNGKAVMKMPADISYTGSTLTLESETELNLYFKNDTDKEMKFSTDSKGVVLASTVSGQQVKLSIKGITAQNLNEFVRVEISLGDDGANEGCYIQYSPMKYCHTVLSRDVNASLQNVMKAFFLYNQKAKEYFRNN
ncbi:MAG: leucine-rich repeat domain-containing protein [Oscillospiraceae bacterium]|nr:leucine-rich repeat domain-containing protein [Oscillospiraceae bacterium]